MKICAFCRGTVDMLPAVLAVDHEQRVCFACHRDPRINTVINQALTPIMNDVQDFMQIGHPDKIADRPGIPPEEVTNLCIEMLRSEYAELKEAIANDDLVEIADGIVDLIYVAIQTAICYGIPAEVWDEVQRTNMAKFPGGRIFRREDGKILKPEGWVPPDIAGILGIKADE